MHEDQWWDCYREGLKGYIVDAAFAHPARVSLSLAKRIYRHALDEGWLKVGDVCLDPMAGVGVFGLVAATYGIRWQGIELESRFVEWAMASILLHVREWTALGKPIPNIMQGDARQMRELLTPAGLQAIVSSPPYVQSVHNGNGIDPTKLTGNPAGKHSQAFAQGYSEPSTMQWPQSTGQLSAMREGSLAMVLTSPPYAEGLSKEHTYRDHAKRDKDSHRKVMREKGIVDPFYGTSDGQLGSMRDPTYWEAMRDIYLAAYDLLPSQGHIMLVLKGFIRRGQYQDLPRQTAQLLAHVGFTVEHYHQAMLDNPVGQAHLFDDGETRTSRKSFFRRLCEQKGAPVITHEAVLCAVKP